MTISRAGARLMTHRLFCGCSLFDRRCFDLGLLALLIGVVQQPIDDARTLLLLDPSVLRFLLLGEEFVVYFPTHWVLHRRRNQRHNNADIIAYGSAVLPECMHRLWSCGESASNADTQPGMEFSEWTPGPQRGSADGGDHTSRSLRRVRGSASLPGSGPDLSKALRTSSALPRSWGHRSGSSRMWVCSAAPTPTESRAASRR